MIKISSINNTQITQATLFENFTQNCDNSYFMQSVCWAKVKSDWKSHNLIYKDAQGIIKATIQILIKEKKGIKTAYAPRGPVYKKSDIEAFEQILKLAVDFCKKQKVIQLKIDPIITDEDITQINIFKKLKFSYTPNMADYTTIQPRGNYLIKNLENKTEDDVLMSFKQKTRYNIKVAIKNGVVCEFGNNKKIVDDYYKLLKVTGIRDGFQVRDKSYYQKILDSFDTNARIYVCYHENDPISAALCINYAKRTYYVFGASDNNKRNLMPTYLMQWSMIKWAIETNCHTYDFMGIPATIKDPSDSMVGVLRFKKGFCGNEVIYCGEFDYNFNPIANSAIKLVKKYYQIATRLKNKLKK